MDKPKDKKYILVLGGTGHYGRHIVQSLLEKGEFVRVLSRNADKARKILGNNPEIIEGDITSRESVINSLKGVKAIIIAVSAFSRKTIRKTKLIELDSVLMALEEAQKTGISRVVYLSAYDLKEDVIEKLNLTQFAETKLEMEARLSKSDFNWTILGCAPSMELFFTMIRGGTMMVPGGGFHALPTISPLDVGEITAQTVLRDDLKGKRFRLTGPESFSFPQAAKRVADVTGRRIKFRKIPLTPIKIASLVTRPFTPYFKYLLQAIILFNNFPPDIAADVPKDHQLLLETFNYTPITLEMEARRRSA
ncbi:MAG: SDR family oxidoreductase [Candidatus Hermodarchaeota archaeon]